MSGSRDTVAGAQSVINWMLYDARRSTRMREFGDELCARMVDAGIPLWRAFCGVRTLHPTHPATAYFWYRDGGGTTRLIADYASRESEEFLNSPVVHAQNTGTAVRRRLCDPGCPMDFAILSEFKEKGGTDYLALPMVFSSGQVNSVSWATDRQGGFTEEDVRGLKDISEMLAVIVELQANRRIARNVLRTYLGPRTGEKVLSGAIQLGTAEQIRAVIWFCDLRGFTSLTDELPRDTVLHLLNDYFAIMATAVTEEGGEVLKFIGDAMLAIFALPEDGAPQERCTAAIRAASRVRREIAERNRERRDSAQPEIRCGLALHLGDVTYGNIGAPDRLDFTVIGPAVNHAARLEKLATTLGQAVVTSASFAAAAQLPLTHLGQHTLRGVAEPQDLFALPDD